MKAGPGDSFLAGRWVIGAKVLAAGGETMGHVIDLEVDPEHDFAVSAVELGRFGWLDRLRAVRPIAHGRLSGTRRVVAWSDVERLEGHRLICRPGAKVVESVPTADEQEPHPDRTEAGG
jgi:hypothetical protein